MNLIIQYAIIITIVTTLSLIAVTSKFQSVNASYCPPGPFVQICNFGQYHLPTGLWSIYVNGTDGILNITSAKFNGNVLGTLQFSNTSGPGKLCSLSKPCNISGIFNVQTGKLSFTSSPTITTFVADIQNYIGYESKQLHGIDTIMYKLDGTCTTVKTQPIKEFGWDASKLCIVGGLC